MDLPTIAGLVLSAGALLFAFLGYTLSLKTKKEQDERALPQIADPHNSFELNGVYSFEFEVFPGTAFHETRAVSVPSYEITVARSKSVPHPDKTKAGSLFCLAPDGKWSNEIPFIRHFSPGTPSHTVRVSVRPVPTGPFEVHIRLGRDAGFVSRTFYPGN